MYDMTVNTQLVVVFYHSPCCIIFCTKFKKKLSWIECIHVSWCNMVQNTVVPALGDPRRERPPAVYGHVINVPNHFNLPIRPSDERPPAMYGHFCLVPRVSVHDRYYCKSIIIIRCYQMCDWVLSLMGHKVACCRLHSYNHCKHRISY